MAALVLHLETACDPERFTRLGQGMLERAGAGPALLVAALEGEAVVLGRHQHGRTAIDLEAARGTLKVVRRVGGGRAVVVGEGAVGVCLVVPWASALGSEVFGADKAINRFVRGVLRGLSKVGADARYYGRDFVSAGGGQLAVVSQDGAPSGAVLFEALIAARRSLELPARLRGYPAHSDARADGPPWVTLPDRPLDLEAVAAAIARGYQSAFGCDVVAATSALEPGPAPEPEVDEPDPAGPLAEVPIGFVHANVSMDAGRLEQVRIRGDFIAPAFWLRMLEADLRGRRPEERALAERVEVALDQDHAVLLGVTDPGVIARAIVAAAKERT